MGWARGLQRTTRRTLKNARSFSSFLFFFLTTHSSVNADEPGFAGLV